MPFRLKLLAHKHLLNSSVSFYSQFCPSPSLSHTQTIFLLFINLINNKLLHCICISLNTIRLSTFNILFNMFLVHVRCGCPSSIHFLLSHCHPLFLWLTTPITHVVWVGLRPPLPPQWFGNRHLTQIRLLRYKMFAEASSGTADEDTFLEIVWCEDSPGPCSAAHLCNIKEPA